MPGGASNERKTIQMSPSTRKSAGKAEVARPSGAHLPEPTFTASNAFLQTWGPLGEYATDAAQRTILFWDVLRQRSQQYYAQRAEAVPHVLSFDAELVLDARTFVKQVNYLLVRIKPPAGVVIDPLKRPFVVVDPRAGHGPGIGGFKADSQVGVALRDGHPVYFVAFRRQPEPGQYLSYVTRTEAAFVREVMRRHPQSPKPIVAGNCQGGWATLLQALRDGPRARRPGCCRRRSERSAP